MLGGVLTSVFQVGLLYVPERVAPDISRLSLLKGLQRIFSLAGTMRLGFGLFKVVVIVTVTAIVVWQRWEAVLGASELSTPQYAQFLVGIALATMLWTGLALVLLALFDYAFQRWKHEQDLRMTHQEVREEMKNLQGDPQIMSRRRAVQRQMVAQPHRQQRAQGGRGRHETRPSCPWRSSTTRRKWPPRSWWPRGRASSPSEFAAWRWRTAFRSSNASRWPSFLYKEVKVGRPVPDKSYAAVAEVLGLRLPAQGQEAARRATGGVTIASPSGRGPG